MKKLPQNLFFWLENDTCYHKLLNFRLENFLLTQHLVQKLAKFQNNDKIDPSCFRGTGTTQRRNVFI